VRRDELEKLKSEFLAISSYDLKTPLNLINGYAEILRDSVSEESKSYLQKIEKSGLLLATQIDELQSLTRFLNTGVGLEKMDSVDIEEITTDIIERLTPIAEKKGVPIVFGTDLRRERREVSGNASAIVKAVNNLISTIISYNDSGEELSINLTNLNSDSIDLQIIGPDNKFSEDFMHSLYGRIWRSVDDEDKEKLGLHITKNIVEFHRGVFLLKKLDGGKSIAQVTLPVKQ